jgi:hypothetical protein
MPTTYFVSYAFGDGSGTWGFGHSNVRLSKSISSFKDLFEIENKIKKEIDVSNITILFWSKYDEEL